MKRLILSILFILCLSFQASAWNPMVVVSGTSGSGIFDCTNYESICQNFEGAGYDNSETWTEAVGDGTVDEDYATIPLVGGQSLQMIDTGVDSTTTETFTAHTDNSTSYLYARFRVDDAYYGEGSIIKLYDGASLCMYVRINVAGKLRLYHGTQADLGDTDIAGGGIWHIWVDWKSETGGLGNGIANLYLSSTGTKPGTAECGLTTGNWDQPGIDTVQIVASALTTVIYDRVLVSNSVIGNQ